MHQSSEDYESRCSSLGPLMSKGMGLHNCGYFARVISRRGCRNSGMRLTLAEGDVVFITNNQLNKPGWLFGIRLTADSSLAEVGLVHRSDIVQVPRDEMLLWPAILDRPIPSSVSSVLFLGGKTGSKIHFGIPARVTFHRTGSTSVRVGTQGEIGRYLDVQVGEVVLLVGYANDNYYAIKASSTDSERVWSGLVYHNDVVLLRTSITDEADPELELVDIQDIRQEPPPFDVMEDLDVEQTVPNSGAEALAFQNPNDELYRDPELQKKPATKLTSFHLRIMRWRSQVYRNSCSGRLTLVN